VELQVFFPGRPGASAALRRNNDLKTTKEEPMTDVFALNQEIPSFDCSTLLAGVFLIFLGMVGIILPAVLALKTVLFFGWLLLAAGVAWAFHTYHFNRKNFSDWLKPFLLFFYGCLINFYPLGGIEAVDLLLAMYLVMDAFGGFSLAREIHPQKGWRWMILNGAVSLVLAAIFLGSRPQSMWLIGVFVGTSLFFDGLSLVCIGWKLKKIRH